MNSHNLKMIISRRKISLLAIVISMLFLPAKTVFAQEETEYTGSINFSIGAKYLNSDEWDPIESQIEYGIDFSFKEKSAPIGFMFGYYYSSSSKKEVEGINVEGNTTEIFGGIKLTSDQLQEFQPFIAGGVVYVEAEFIGTLEGLSVTIDGHGIGYWLGAGVYSLVSENISIGVNIRYSKANATIGTPDEDYEVDSGGVHGGLMVGYHF